MRPLLVIALALLFTTARAEECRPVPRSPLLLGERDPSRVLELAGQAEPRPHLFERASAELFLPRCGEPELPGRAVLAIPVVARGVANGGYPADLNDGALWAGRGVSAELRPGVVARWGPLSAGLIPTLAWQQNRDFVRPGLSPALLAAIPTLSPFANPFQQQGAQFDLPLRMGPGPFSTVDPGQSFVRLDLWNVALGFSTENLWWGPGQRNALVLTDSAAGFPHVFLGTRRPADIWIGKLEAQMVWGRLRESKWFDSDSTNDRRQFTALTLGFEPAFAPGLWLGLARAYQYRIPPEGLPWKDYFTPLLQPFLKENLATTSNPGGSSPDNQLGALYVRYAFPQVGFEVYGEWGRDDHSWDLLDLAMEPEHSQAFILGLQKVTRTRAGLVRVVVETTNTFEKPVAHPTRPTPIFYSHFSVVQGWTQAGQMLGAGLGPEGNEQYASVDLFRGSDHAGVFLERAIRWQRYFFDNVATWEGHDLELTAGARYGFARGPLAVELEASFSRRWNAYFTGTRNNPAASLAVSWAP
jgi:hypothetical protein